MSIELTVIASIFLVFTTIASGGALFVSMKVSGSIAKFRNELVKELDDRYIRKNEHNQVDAIRQELDDQRRATSKERLAGVEIELHRYHDDLNIVLKNILVAIKEVNPEKHK
jgi:hypothetical protein